MSAPQLTVQRQGVGAVSADYLDGLIQSCNTFADLRAFVGTTGMQVYVRGTTAFADGGQGFYSWSATATANDGFYAIRPAGVGTAGAWLRVPVGGLYTPAFELLGGTPPLANEIIGLHSIVAPCSFPSNFAGSTGFTLNNPTATYTAPIYQNALTNHIGDMQIHTDGTFSFSTLSSAVVTCAKGDALIIKGQGTTDATLADFCWTFLGSLL